MAEIVLDASAILALLRLETGAEEVEEVIADSVVSVVNESEVISKLIWRGQTPDQALEVVRSLPYRLMDLDVRTARRAGVMWRETNAHRLSFADRCCLALAEREQLPVLTADTGWAKVAVGVQIQSIAGRRRS